MYARTRSNIKIAIDASTGNIREVMGANWELIWASMGIAGPFAMTYRGTIGEDIGEIAIFLDDKTSVLIRSR